MFAGLLAEIRAYGEGLIIAEQIPERLVQDVIKNTAVKITHRLPAADDRDAVGATMNMTGAPDHFLVTLPPGQAAVFADGMDYAGAGADARRDRPGSRSRGRHRDSGRGGPGRAASTCGAGLHRAPVHAAGHAGGPAHPG